MDDVSRWILFLLFLTFSFLFCAVETALVSINESKIKEMIQKNKQYKKVSDILLDQPMKRKIIWSNLTYLICICITIYHGYLLSYATLFGLLKKYLTAFQQETWFFWIDTIGLGIISFLISILISLVFANMLPRRIFSQHNEMFLLRLFRPIRVLSLLFRPLVFLIVKLSNGICLLFGIQNRLHEEYITEEEIRSMVEEGQEHGVIEQEEREMINNIFDFDNRTASDLMTHRTDVIAVEFHSKISDVVYYAINEGFSRIPVYENDIDNIKGIIYVKDLLCLVGCNSSEDFTLNDFIRKTIYVPEAKKCIDLFQIFKTKKIHMAIVVDDYGGTAGIITMEDLLESIVGNIQDEYDDEQEEVIQLNENTYLLDGSINLEKLNRLLQLELKGDDSDTDTIGGLITEMLGRIPDDNENPTIEISPFRFTVMLVEDRRIIKVKAQKIPPQQDQSEAS